MRRDEKQVTDTARIEVLLRTEEVMRVSFNDDDYPYTVPVNFGYFMEGNTIVLYFHCAKEGKKTDLIEKDPRTFVLIDGNHDVIRGNRACSYTYQYLSLMGRGHSVKVKDVSEKEFALNCIMNKFTGNCSFQFPQDTLEKVEIIRTEITDYTCKENS